MKVFIVLLLACLICPELCAHVERRLGIPKKYCGPAIKGADAIVGTLMACAVKQLTGFKMPEKKKKAMTHKITTTILGKFGCKSRRMGFLAKTAKKMAKKAMCKIAKKYCSPACTAGVTAVAITAASYGIPVSCAKGPVTKACVTVCKKVCKK